MYLYVFVMLIVAIMGIYTELFSLRLARIAEKQTTIADTVYKWHLGAFGLADAKDLTTVDVNGCSLTPAVVPYCVDGASVSTFLSGIDVDGVRYLPTGYPYATMQFDSRLFQLDGSRYVITFVRPGAVLLGYTQPQIWNQVKNMSLGALSHGRVQAVCAGGVGAGPWFVPPPISDGAGVPQTLCFRVGNQVPVDSVGFISFY